MKKKIVFFLPTLNGGGAERVSINIMRELNVQYYDIHLILVERKGEYLELIPGYVTLHVLQSSKTLYAIMKLRSLIQALKPDILYSTLYRTHIASYVSLLGVDNRPKTIFRMPNSPKLVIQNKEISKTMKVLLDLALKSATKVIAQTPQMKEEIIHYHGVDDEKIDVVINPLDKAHIKRSIEQGDSPFDFRYTNVVASGRLMHQKGYDILILAFKEVYKRNQSFKLFIIGGDYANKQKEYESMVKKLELEGVIEFLGFQKNPYLYYYHSDLFVMSSRWEGLPNTVLENLYLEKPIVATNCIPFMEELIRDGQNGLLVEVENTQMLAESILKYEQIPQRGYLKSFAQEDINARFNL
ncbi:MAG TPA: glycosyltransferase [Bacteroidetes bacterium]|nr:glycosyltransferase [Bacteroidota bacterium]